MTSSLVGSEMCIRDSFIAASVALCRIRGCVGNAACNSSWGTEHGSGPVSYTHLTLPTICSV
eukprot:4899374-Prorocentrum_lima.AAC.1